jgi:hypothetical protein
MTDERKALDRGIDARAGTALPQPSQGWCFCRLQAAVASYVARFAVATSQLAPRTLQLLGLNSMSSGASWHIPIISSPPGTQQDPAGCGQVHLPFTCQ